MKKSFIVNGHEVEFTECTAIAASIGDTKRQKALFVHDCEDEFGNGDGVLFFAAIPDDTNEAAALLMDAIDTYEETLSTVELVEVIR